MEDGPRRPEALSAFRFPASCCIACPLMYCFVCTVQWPGLHKPVVRLSKVCKPLLHAVQDNIDLSCMPAMKQAILACIPGIVLHHSQC